MLFYRAFVLLMKPRTFAQLPASPQEGQMVSISNADTAVWGAAITGTGTNHVLARFNGTAWTVVGK